MPTFSVDGIVSHRDEKPYIRIFKDKEQLGQFSMAEARNLAHDILTMCSRTEADAMLFKFFKENNLPMQAVAALMVDFRTFRLKLDVEPVGKTISDPDEKENPVN